ncbi:hypothetical protein GO755_27700 [Spirosoma sp. HMF4905]|uniref:Lipocalin-like domain-containing protein n=1 Tax=Spirosoma arboris TaxID=2682092 RepID=A0A7K1SJ78_9BACT|nr:hypothetical protein [Spirosoma arboris]MVM33852.1 hypothetical protein [Spirosoma arboris]
MKTFTTSTFSMAAKAALTKWSTNHYHFVLPRISWLVLVFLVLTNTACQPGNGLRPNEYGNGPRKTVPAELVGEWQLTQVSSTNVVSPNGHTVPAWAFGAVFHINPDGTGFSIVTASTATYSSEDTQRVETNGTYEIDLDSNGDMQFKYYPANGKVYNNDVFAHDLAVEKLYPATYTNWFGKLTTYYGKTCFESEQSNGTIRYFKQ